MSILKSEYYDHPEGSDAIGKMVATNKYAAAAGLSWSVFDVLMVSHPKGYLPTLARIAYNTGPLMGMASAFTMTTYVITNVRGKDDRLNYFLGGMAAGCVYGAWKRSVVAGCVSGLFLGIAGTVKKLSKIEGWEFFPEVHTRYSSISPHDWTLMTGPPKNWTTEQPAEKEAE
ncbi:NADH dehydrogenase [ubiquinone] 1 alpha subcomplex subunit 11 [Teleopsis dalmanni]|uniref:NADH dehydrogenase [ubiquinone] 1 alpha subcomplex subunit 11 n=1 Tax=Teleopsis dalmanni TaxID=139649 RepID=UPI0018CDEF35|nr:NADH dehydrogenase [ubiquinone] 1 alpha subcomplex subunit 11 [Teleopsis dalmanni]XP_037948795.1 NADH dehydrogenase [ubiquinone] 1 alpha subcomplex subunit 11 [Teleopsis dalmanni]XP_037948796.1 NADH dehydrogenase [ubiquinone] 1 alpha subcomplex subunit 11 [Teleopsis dalmanni]XP_037948797.1 NADH dehydrogenase [ubiquinone] 1 alpha subcomplex subunit 11 [Teleopsis dalmanni]